MNTGIHASVLIAAVTERGRAPASPGEIDVDLAASAGTQTLAPPRKSRAP